MHVFADCSLRQGTRVLLVLTSCLLSVGLATAQEAVPAPLMPGKLQLQDGDTFVFLGDSITHQRLYTQYFETFVYSRIPGRRIRFHNAGVGGAQAWDALQRLQQDVIALKPQYVSILLGMNDGRYQPFNRAIFDRYQQDMGKVVSQLQDAGAASILMSPTMFDSRAASLQKRARAPEMLAEYNSVLAYYGRWLQHQAIEGGLGWVDMFGPLNRISVTRRRKDANFTIIRDAVHPDPPGQLVMALAMIEQLGMGRPLSSIVVRTGGRQGPRARVQGGEIDRLLLENGQLEFDWMANGLPWVLPTDVQDGVKLTRASRRVSGEVLRVVGLPVGRYDVLIDDVVVHTCGAEQLAQGVNLESNDKTPQYQQALQVATLNAAKNQGPVAALRNAWRIFQGFARVQRDAQAQPDNVKLQKNLAAVTKKLEGHTERVEVAQHEIADFDNQIYAANQPPSRHYVIRKVTN